MPNIPFDDPIEAARTVVCGWHYRVGTPVRLSRVNAPAFDTITRTLPWVQETTPMIVVAGWSRPVALDMVTVRGEAPPRPPQTLLVHWADPGERDPASSEVSENAEAYVPRETVVLRRSVDIGSDDDIRSLYLIASHHDRFYGYTRACLAYVKVGEDWRPGVVETYRARLARLEAEIAAAERR